ncbi:MAG: hypothetical protein IPH44_43270 [Myxococcales bacterium]|nr:hypothetical protein [Myxococcales bacterium]MBK7192781.1 hypothetical protein [Myxococcales bacterium]
MNRPIPLMFTALACAIIHAPSARAEEPSAPATTAAADQASSDAAATAVETAEDSLASPPAVMLFRGGSLGIPAAAGTRSVQASSTLKLDNPSDGSAVDFDFMAKVGGLNLYDEVMVDIVGEQYQQALPVVTLGGPTALPVMTATTVKSAGMRVVRRGPRRGFDVTRAKAFDRSLPQDETGARAAQRVFVATSGDWWGFGLRALHPSLSGADEASLRGFATELTWQRVTDFEVSDECKRELEAAEQGAVADATAAADRVTTVKEDLTKINSLFTETSPDRITTLLAPEAPGTAAALAELRQRQTDLERTKAAADADLARAVERKGEAQQALLAPKSVCGASRRHTYFLSLAATYLNSQRLTPEGMPAIAMPEVVEVRVAGGAELQSGTRLGKYLLPRLGAYAAVSAARWDNAFATNGASDAVTQWQAELALYTSGHFTGGFSGLLSVGVLLPYGHDAEPQAFINIAPTVGAPLGGS